MINNKSKKKKNLPSIVGDFLVVDSIRVCVRVRVKQQQQQQRVFKSQ